MSANPPLRYPVPTMGTSHYLRKMSDDLEMMVYEEGPQTENPQPQQQQRRPTARPGAPTNNQQQRFTMVAKDAANAALQKRKSDRWFSKVFQRSSSLVDADDSLTTRRSSNETVVTETSTSCSTRETRSVPGSVTTTMTNIKTQQPPPRNWGAGGGNNSSISSPGGDERSEKSRGGGGGVSLLGRRLCFPRQESPPQASGRSSRRVSFNETNEEPDIGVATEHAQNMQKVQQQFCATKPWQPEDDNNLYAAEKLRPTKSDDKNGLKALSKIQAKLHSLQKDKSQSPKSAFGASSGDEMDCSATSFNTRRRASLNSRAVVARSRDSSVEDCGAPPPSSSSNSRRRRRSRSRSKKQQSPSASIVAQRRLSSTDGKQRVSSTTDGKRRSHSCNANDRPITTTKPAVVAGEPSGKERHTRLEGRPTRQGRSRSRRRGSDTTVRVDRVRSEEPNGLRMEPTGWNGEQQQSENEKRGRLLKERETSSTKNAGRTKVDRQGRSSDNRVDQQLMPSSQGSCDHDGRNHRHHDDDAATPDNNNEDDDGRLHPLLLFRRKLHSGKILGQTTVLAQPDDTMSAIIKRLQGEESDVESLGHAHSNVLTFSNTEVAALKNGDLQIVFSLRHVKGAKFDRDEFGRVQAEKILSLSNIRPLVVDILTEKRPEGEKLTLY